LHDDNILFVADFSNARLQMLNAVTGSMYCEMVGIGGPLYDGGITAGPSCCRLSKHQRCTLYINNPDVTNVDHPVPRSIDIVTFDPDQHSMRLQRRISQLSMNIPQQPSSRNHTSSSDVGVTKVSRKTTPTITTAAQWLNVNCICVSRRQSTSGKEIIYITDMLYQEGHHTLLAVEVDFTHAMVSNTISSSSSNSVNPGNVNRDNDRVLFSALPNSVGRCERRFEPSSLAISPSGRFLFLSDLYGRRLVVLDSVDGTELVQMVGQGGPLGLCFANHSSKLFFCDCKNHQIVVLEVKEEPLLGE
jgi:hypothetical protein